MKKLKEKFANNEKVIWIKKMWDNKRYRSLFFLGCYFVFFIFLGIGFRTTPNVSDGPSEPTTPSYDATTIMDFFKQKSVQDYDYQMVINNIVIDGSVKNGTNSFLYEDNQYIIVYDKLYRNQDGNLLYEENFLGMLLPVSEITISNISNILEHQEPVTENITEEKYELLYQVSSFEFIEEENNMVAIKISGQKGMVDKVEITYQTDIYILEIKE